jgi:hypothetical protein
MRKSHLLLIAAIFGTILLTLLLVLLRNNYFHVISLGITFSFVKEKYFNGFIFTVILITIPAFILGLISWLFFKKKYPDKILHFAIFNLIGLVLLMLANVNEMYNIWHYNKYQANMDHNSLLTYSNGGFVDTCMIMIQDDIQSQGVLPNDYRILSYSYEPELATVPKDTTNKYYSFDIIYSKNHAGTKTIRAACYFINFNQKIKRVYDVDTKDEKATKQM